MSRIFKRTFDLSVAGILLILTSPLLLFTAILIRLFLARRVLFRQERAGLGGRVFRIYKFTTMLDSRASDGTLLPDEQRLTRLGRLIRASSVDELPGLLNVLSGDMSLVGPRPLLADYLPLYSAEQMRRHEVLPGVTGWAQVNGRNALGWEDRFKLDVWYVDHWSLGLDFKILWMTVKKVVVREGISSANHVTSFRFTGNQPTKSSQPLEKS